MKKNVENIHFFNIANINILRNKKWEKKRKITQIYAPFLQCTLSTVWGLENRNFAQRPNKIFGNPVAGSCVWKYIFKRNFWKNNVNLTPFLDAPEFGGLQKQVFENRPCLLCYSGAGVKFFRGNIIQRSKNGRKHRNFIKITVFSCRISPMTTIRKKKQEEPQKIITILKILYIFLISNKLQNLLQI